jgi:hypothetical protein
MIFWEGFFLPKKPLLQTPMIESLFLFLFFFMMIFLGLALKFNNVALASLTILLCLILAINLIPGIGSVTYRSGANITISGDNIVVVDSYASFTNIYLALILLVLALYLGGEILDFRKNRKKEREESIE